MSTPTDWLDAVLSARGRGALPYRGESKWGVRQHLLDLVQEFPTLVLKVDEYTYPNGKSQQLLCAEGTLPMYYLGTKYNIPITLWVPETYPRAAPLLYVTPTPDMVVKPRHTFVDGAGLVSSAYVSAWAGGGSGGVPGGTSNLVDLCHDASIQFGSEPPLFAKPPGWNESGGGGGGGAGAAATAAGSGGSSGAATPARPPPTDGIFQASNPIHSSPQGGRPSGGGGGIWGGALAAMAAALGGGGGGSGGGASARPASASGGGPVAHPLPSPSGASQPPSSSDPIDLDAAWRAAAAAGLAARLRGALAAAAAADAAATTVDGHRRAELADRAARLEAGRAALEAEKAALEDRVGALRGQAAALDAWLAANEAKAPGGGSGGGGSGGSGSGGAPPVDPDTAVEPADPLSRQALAGQAEDMAIEDALYALDRALSAGGVGAEAYLRSVRRLCGRQFTLRALGARVAAAQAQAGGGCSTFGATPAGGGGGGPSGDGSSVALPQGDSWASSGVLAATNPLVGGGGGGQ